MQMSEPVKNITITSSPRTRSFTAKTYVAFRWRARFRSHDAHCRRLLHLDEAVATRHCFRLKRNEGTESGRVATASGGGNHVVSAHADGAISAST